MKCHLIFIFTSFQLEINDRKGMDIPLGWGCDEKGEASQFITSLLSIFCGGIKNIGVNSNWYRLIGNT